MSTMAQLNVRMKPELKAAGDSILELYGIAPSEFIRTMWEKISLGEEAFRQVAEALAADPAAGSYQGTSAAEARHGFANQIRQLQADYEYELGMTPSTYIPLSEEQLEELIYEDYLEERRATHAD